MSVWATVWAWEQELESPGQKLVLLALAQFADEFAKAFPSQQTVSEMTLQGERSVRRHLQQLELAGLIQREPRWRKDGTRTSDQFQLAGGARPSVLGANSKQPGEGIGAQESPSQPAAKLAGGDGPNRPKTTGPPAMVAATTGQIGQGSCQRSDQRINHSSDLSTIQANRSRKTTERERRCTEKQAARPLTDAEAKRGLEHIRAFLRNAAAPDKEA